MKKYLYPIVISKIRPYLKYWFLFGKKFAELVSLVSQTLPLTLNNTLDLKFEKFQPDGATVQDGTPTPETQVEIKNVKGVNLFDKNNPNLFYSYIVIDGNITFPSDGGDENQCIYIPCKSNMTYTVQKKLGKRFAVAYTYNIPAQGVSGYGAITGYSSESITITTNNNAKYLVVYIRNGNVSGELTLEEALNSILIKEGSVPSPYVPYNSIEFKVENSEGTEEQTALFTFEEGQYLAEGGYLADDGIHNIRKKAILNETIQMSYNGTAGQFYIENQQILQNYVQGSIILANYLKYSSTTWVENCFGVTNSNVLWLYIKDGPTSVSELREYLTTHNIKFEYLSTQEQITKYTPAQQAQWNAIKNLYGYNEQTIISCTGSKVIPKLSIDYYVKGGE